MRAGCRARHAGGAEFPRNKMTNTRLFCGMWASDVTLSRNSCVPSVESAVAPRQIADAGHVHVIVVDDSPYVC
jgi:hypothetical protein